MSVDVKIINHSSIKVGVERFNCPDPLPIAYNYPLTGQTTIYATSGGVEGDDAWAEQNVIAPRRIAGRAPILVDFFTLHSSTPNKWGGTDRFTDTLGGQDYDNGILQDHDQGVELLDPTGANLSWNNAIADALGTDFPGGTNNAQGFTDWFMPNLEIISRVMNNEEANQLIWTTEILGNLLWTSSTPKRNINEAWRIVLDNEVQVRHSLKTTSGTFRTWYCRLIDQ